VSNERAYASSSGKIKVNISGSSRKGRDSFSAIIGGVSRWSLRVYSVSVYNH